MDWIVLLIVLVPVVALIGPALWTQLTDPYHVKRLDRRYRDDYSNRGGHEDV